MELGVYIHYPWCRSRCSYCDFAIAIAPDGRPPHERYLAAVLAELAARAGDFSSRSLVSIYFGGGTPSLWPAACLARAIAAVVAAFPGVRPADLEITLEVNPTDCAPANLGAWRAAGINRLSIGVQSFDAGDLVVLGRDHAMGDGAAALAAAASADFALSADLILGVPGARRPLAGVEAMAAHGPPHLSVYELGVEEGTPLHARVARGEVRPEDEDRLADLYEAAHRTLEAAGYHHYEVSSYARPGHRARHNSLYWRGVEYLGLGNGAHSLRRIGAGARRSANHRSVGRYLASPGAWEASGEDLSPAAFHAELTWLGLRTAAGVAVTAFDRAPALLGGLVGDRLVSLDGDRVRPTLRGYLLANQLAARVVAALTPGDPAR